MNPKRALLLVVLGICLCVISPSVSAQVLRRGNQDPQTIDPHKSNYLFEHAIEDDLFEGLVILDPKGQVKGGAASNWELSTDATRYTFRLRPGLHWSNGDALTANDFVYSFRRLVNPATKSPSAFLAYPIKNATEIATGKNPNLDQLGVEALGDDTLRITLSVPIPYFLAALTNACFFPVNQKSVARFGDDFTKPGNLIGNGAYVLQEWTPKVRLVLKRNPYYWDADHVKIEVVQYLAMPVASEEYQRYLAGDIDITWDVPGDKIAAVRANRPNEFKVFPHFGVYYYAFDLKSAPFKDNPKLRRSLSMTVDRELITREIVGGGEPPAFSWVPPGLPGYEPQTVDWKKLPREQRLAQAKELYAEAGYGPTNPLRLTIDGIRTEVRRKTAEAITKQWKEALGVEAAIAPDNASDSATKPDPSVGRVLSQGWNADYADPNTFLQIWTSDSTDNPSGYQNEAYDALIRQAALKNTSERAKLLEQAERILLNDLPVIPIHDFVTKKMVRPNVIGFSPNILGYAYSKDISLADTAPTPRGSGSKSKDRTIEPPTAPKVVW